MSVAAFCKRLVISLCKHFIKSIPVCTRILQFAFERLSDDEASGARHAFKKLVKGLPTFYNKFQHLKLFKLNIRFNYL